VEKCVKSAIIYATTTTINPFWLGPTNGMLNELKTGLPKWREGITK